MKITRIVVGLDPRHRASFDDLARHASALQAELLGLFVEDEQLLRFAELPFAREIGYPSATRRPIDRASVERAFRLKAEDLRRACARASQTCSISWSFRVARGALAEQLFAAVSERAETTLLLPPGSRWDVEPVQVSAERLDALLLRDLLAGARPLLIVAPEG